MQSETYYGRQKVVFANQDDGIFSAVPITFDESVLTLETYTEGARKFVKAGSVVKYGNTVKGITAEEYEITDGPVTGRVALEGYVYVENLTEGAAATIAMNALPKIVPIPFGKIIFDKLGARGLNVFIRTHGTVWTGTVATTHFTIQDGTPATNMEIESVTRDANDHSLVKLTFKVKASQSAQDGTLQITQISSSAVSGSAGKVIAGLPISITFKDGEVCEDA